MNDPGTTTANLDGVQISYRDAGTGPVLLLIHAFPLSGAMWEAQSAALSRTRRVIVPDLRGFGGSPVVAGTSHLDQYADDLAALLDHLGLAGERAALGGLSMGGYIAFAFLRRHPQRVGALILADTRAQADTEDAKQGREKTARLVEEKGPGVLADQMMAKLLAANAPEDLRAKVRGMIEDNDRAGIAAALRAMAARPDATPQLGAIKAPTLVIVGREDALTPPADARMMHEAIPGSRLVEIPGAGHLSNLEAPELFNATLTDFLKSS